MDVRRTLKSARLWLRALARNRYFWGGIGGLFLLGLLAYVLVDSVIMPSYTRQEAAIHVPNVEGQPFEKAKEQLQKKEFQVRRDVGRYNPRVDPSTVVDQNPPPKSDVKPGRRVYLTVNASDVPMVSIPDLNGISVREAKNRVSSLGLTVDTVMADTIPAPYRNTVTRQRPQPGDSLQRGEGVALWYSTGLAQDSVEVPDVVGRTVDEAQTLLLNRRLRSIVVDSRGASENAQTRAAGDTSYTVLYVQRQGRAPQTTVRAGTEIRLFATPDPSAVPSPASDRDSIRSEPDL